MNQKVLVINEFFEFTKTTFKKKLGDEIGRKYVRVTKTIKERQERDKVKNDK